MKKFISIFTFFYFLSVVNLFSYNSDPKEFVGELVNDVITKLSDKSVSSEEKAKFIEKVALEYVDISALGLYTLGEIRKSAEKNEIQRYQVSFEKYFLKSLTSRLNDYSSSSFEVLGADQKALTTRLLTQKLHRRMEILKLKLIGGCIPKILKNP